MSQILESPLHELSQLPAQDRGWHVVVYNNDTNTYEEVILILLLATHCTEEEAAIETWEIDHLGQSVVHIAGEEECQSVAEVIRTIGIKVEVTAAP